MPRELVRGALLTLGGVIIVASGLFTLTHFTDRAVYTVLVPGVVMGLLLVGVYWILGNRGNPRWPG